MRRLQNNELGRFQPVQGACAQVNVSCNTLMKIASGCNAIVRFGRSVRIDMPVLYKHIDMTYRAGE